VPPAMSIDLHPVLPISLSGLLRSDGKMAMAIYRVREVRILELDGGMEKITALREYELDSAGARAAAEEVRHFFEVEILNLKAPQKIDFDALVVVDSKGFEVARFKVSDVWMRQADAVNSGKSYSHWV
jgi:hypothetical protein